MMQEKEGERWLKWVFIIYRERKWVQRGSGIQGRHRWPISKFCSFGSWRDYHGNRQVPKEVYSLLFWFSHVLHLHNQLSHQADPPSSYTTTMKRTAVFCMKVRKTRKIYVCRLVLRSCYCILDLFYFTLTSPF